jgi:hypothetical protein
MMDRIKAILAGIDKTETEHPDGWWETSVGAEFGARKLAEIRAAIEPPSQFSATVTNLNPIAVASELARIAEMLRAGRAAWDGGGLIIQPTDDGVEIRSDLRLKLQRAAWSGNPARIVADLAARAGHPLNEQVVETFAAYCDEPVTPGIAELAERLERIAAEPLPYAEWRDEALSAMREAAAALRVAATPSP